MKLSNLWSNEQSTREKYRTILATARHEYNRDLKLYYEIRSLLVEKFTGKKITKRALDYIRSKHPSWTVYLAGVAMRGVRSSTYIRVWGGDSGWTTGNNCGSVCLGYFDTHANGFNPAKLDENNPSIPNTEKAKRAVEIALANPCVIEEVSNTIDEFVAMKNKLVKVLEYLPEHYELERLAGLRKD